MTELKLNLGCGTIHMDGYVNIDGYPTEERGGTVSAADRYMMIEDLDYPPGSVDQIICIHTFEHLTQAQVEKALGCWFDCLKPGGTLIIEVPDAEAIMRRLLRAKSSEEKDLYYYLLYGTQEFSAEHHMMGHTYERLERVLRAAGFTGFVNGKQRPKAIADQRVYEMFRGRRWRCVLIQCHKPSDGGAPDPDEVWRALYFEYKEQDLKGVAHKADEFLWRGKRFLRSRIKGR
ncbi:MAG TPA: methyltransferase domain-containing protein [Actinomycetota bacterium]|nr:methyltransferase domain-containing protein [Actinomycetota bacterium]